MLPVRVFNPTKEERVVKQGTMVACLTELQEADDVQAVQHDDVKSGTGGDLPPHLAELFGRSIQDVPERYHAQVASCCKILQMSSREGQKIWARPI